MDFDDFKLSVLTTIIMLILAVPIYWGYGSWKCWATFSDTKYKYRFSLLKGCQYKTKNGWYPSEKFRNIEAN